MENAAELAKLYGPLTGLFLTVVGTMWRLYQKALDDKDKGYERSLGEKDDALERAEARNDKLEARIARLLDKAERFADEAGAPAPVAPPARRRRTEA